MSSSGIRPGEGGIPISKILAAFCVVVTLVPMAAAGGLLPVNPIVNGDFDTNVQPGGVGLLYPYMNQCIGVGHQVMVPLYSSWGDWVFETASEPTGVDPTDPGLVGTATGYPTAYAMGHVTDPMRAVRCDPSYLDIAQPNPWNTLNDPSFMWSNDPGTVFGDANGDGDIEAVIPRVPAQHNHNLWQSVATPTQAFSADFDAFEFTLESGVIPAGANIQVGLSLTPGYMQSPWVGIFWEGAVLFRANDLVPGAGGRISVDPVAKGEIICPAYTPCYEFRAAYNAADEEGKRTLLGQTRIVQTSFWSFNGGVGPVVIDDVAYVGAKTFAETVPNPNPGA